MKCYDILSVYSLVRNGFDFPVPFLDSCLYISIMELEKEKPLMTNHLFTIFSRHLSAISWSTMNSEAKHQSNNKLSSDNI